MGTVEQARSGHVVIGVDTHKHIHVAAVMDSIGGVLATLTIATDTLGYRQLLQWATGFGKIIAFGIEGTGSYGAVNIRLDGSRGLVPVLLRVLSAEHCGGGVVAALEQFQEHRSHRLVRRVE